MTMRPSFLITIAFSSLVNAAAFAEERAARPFEVVQFGVPQEATYLFCATGNCPERSIKHLLLLTAPAQPSAQTRSSRPAEAPMIVLAKREEVHQATRVGKKPIKRKRTASKISCMPSS